MVVRIKPRVLIKPPVRLGKIEVIAPDPAEFILPYAYIWWDETSTVTEFEWQPRRGTIPLRKRTSYTVNIDTDTRWNGNRVVHLSAPGDYSDCWAPDYESRVQPPPSLGIATPFELWLVAQMVGPFAEVLTLMDSVRWMNLYDYGGNPGGQFSSLSFYAGVGASGAVSVETTVPYGSRMLIRIVREPGRAALWQNGTLVSDTVQPWTSGAEFNQLRISNQKESYYAEIAITDRLPDEVAGQFSEYLMNKWGIT
ncbi:MAG: hypothetical protein WC942_06100 [Clostridia bacterium]